MRFFCVLGALLFLSGCIGPPENVVPVGNFDLSRYFGMWHEIARLDHRFERGLTRVVAIYSPRGDRGVKVVNKGFEEKTGMWKSVEGKAYFVGPTDTASLKVSFFGPFYAGYHVIALDRENYEYAMVCGAGRDYLWILSRKKTLDRDIVEKLLEKAERLGFNTGDLIFEPGAVVPPT